MLRKKPTQLKQQLLLRYPVNRQEVRKLKSLNEKSNQPDCTFVFLKTAFAKPHRSCQAQ